MIDIKNETTLNKIILDSLVLENIIIEPDIIIHATLHNDLYYESPFLLSAAQSLMPMIN